MMAPRSCVHQGICECKDNDQRLNGSIFKSMGDKGSKTLTNEWVMSLDPKQSPNQTSTLINNDIESNAIGEPSTLGKDNM